MTKQQTEHPILFSTPMVQAILEGRKTQTRRIVKEKMPLPSGTYPAKWNYSFWEGSPFREKNGDYPKHELIDGVGKVVNLKCPYGKKGDILWVREAFEIYVCNDGGSDYTQLRRIADDSYIDYSTNMRASKHPSLHFPKEACRLFLEITNIRVERLQDISEEDAKAEGVAVSKSEAESNYYHRQRLGNIPADHQLKFFNLWREIYYINIHAQLNGTDSFGKNPFVWVIEFKKIDK